MAKLLLASSSKARASVLKRLHIPFSQYSPDIDETPLPGESALALVTRLSQEKARVVAERYPDHIIIAGDQVAEHGDAILGKPHTFECATEMLLGLSDQTVTFHSGLCVVDPSQDKSFLDVVPTTVSFRPLTRRMIEHYLTVEEPFACAGSLKSEALGISLLSELSSSDPTALIGLPLIRLTDFLLALDYPILGSSI